MFIMVGIACSITTGLLGIALLVHIWLAGRGCLLCKHYNYTRRFCFVCGLSAPTKRCPWFERHQGAQYE
jgi:hypothetical protein